MRTQKQTMRLIAGVALLALAAMLPAAADAPGEGRAFVPRGLTPELYGISAPTAATQNTTIEGAGGTDIYIEWWLPTPKDGNVPPARLPVIAMLSPYQQKGNPREADTMTNVVTRGYAYAAVHLRGTGSSGGCQEQFSSNEVGDAANAIEWLGRDAPFSNGSIGASGLSYPGITQVMAAGRGAREKVKYLKAIVAGGVATSQYDYNFFDGVPFTGQAVAHSASYNGANSLPSAGTSTYPVERVSCVPGVMAGSADSSGSMTPFWQDRDGRPGAKNTTAAVLIYHGHRDEIDREIALAGYFDQLPSTTPKHAIIGSWAHAYPDDVRGTSPWPRADWEAMKLAWFDRHVRGDTSAGTEQWPTVQVQDSEGQWRAEPDWPAASGPQRGLALSSGGALGADTPTGSSQFVEGLYTEGPAGKTGRGRDEGRLVFSTPPLAGPLHVTGQPVLDMWVQLDRPDAHLAARVVALDESGRRVPYAETMGFRSMQHLDPLVDNRFVQTEAKLPPVGVPIRVRVRFDPASLVVPEGGRLELTLAGSLAPNTLTASQPSGLGTVVTVLHDCKHPSALTFQTLADAPDFLNVQEEGEELPLASEPARAVSSDGGGLASTPPCQPDGGA